VPNLSSAEVAAMQRAKARAIFILEEKEISSLMTSGKDCLTV